MAAFVVNVGDRPTFFLFVAIINYLVYFTYYCEPILVLGWGGEDIVCPCQ